MYEEKIEELLNQAADAAAGGALRSPEAQAEYYLQRASVYAMMALTETMNNPAWVQTYEDNSCFCGGEGGACEPETENEEPLGTVEVSTIAEVVSEVTEEPKSRPKSGRRRSTGKNE